MLRLKLELNARGPRVAKNTRETKVVRKSVFIMKDRLFFMKEAKAGLAAQER